MRPDDLEASLGIISSLKQLELARHDRDLVLRIFSLQTCRLFAQQLRLDTAAVLHEISSNQRMVGLLARRCVSRENVIDSSPNATDVVVSVILQLTRPPDGKSTARPAQETGSIAKKKEKIDTHKTDVMPNDCYPIHMLLHFISRDDPLHTSGMLFAVFPNHCGPLVVILQSCSAPHAIGHLSFSRCPMVARSW